MSLWAFITKALNCAHGLPLFNLIPFNTLCAFKQLRQGLSGLLLEMHELLGLGPYSCSV